MAKTTKLRARSLLAMTVSFISVLPVFANRPAPRNPAYEAAARMMKQTWHPSESVESEPLLRFSVADNGFIYNPEIARHSGNDQHDAECLEAFCDLSPLDCAIGKTQSSLTLGSMTTRFEPGEKSPEIAEYRKAHPFLQNDPSVVLHRIPLSVAIKYPDLITKEQICSTTNLFQVKYRKVEEFDGIGNRVRPEPEYANVIRNKNDEFKLHLLDYGRPVTKQALEEIAGHWQNR